MADHRGIGKQEEGFSDQRAEGRDCQPQDVAVDRLSAEESDASILRAMGSPSGENP
jgi:hypothetical protein